MNRPPPGPGPLPSSWRLCDARRDVSADGQAAAGEGIAFETPAGRWVLGVAVLGSGIAFLDGTVVNVALPDIGRDLDASTSSLQWVLNGYLLTLASFILLGGSLGDRHGRRRVFVVGRRRVHGRLAALRDRAQRRDAGRGAVGAGRRRRAAHPRQPRDDRGELPTRRSRPGDRRLVGPRRRRRRARAVARRLAGRGGFLAGDLPDQPPARAARDPVRKSPRPRDAGPDGQWPARLPRRHARRAGPCRHDLRADRGARQGDERADRDRRVRRPRGAGRIPAGGAAEPPTR